MRPDQIARLQALTVTLVDVVVVEADPATWPATGVAPADLTQQERGDRYWCKRNAAATVGLLERITRALADVQSGSGKREDERPELDREIADAEKRASLILERVQKAAASSVRGRP